MNGTTATLRRLRNLFVVYVLQIDTRVRGEFAPPASPPG